MALIAYAAKCYDIPQLSVHQLSVVDKIHVFVILKLIEDVTRSISSDNASVSVIIPFVRALSKSWEDIDDEHGVQIMKDEMLYSLHRQFNDVESNEYCTYCYNVGSILGKKMSFILA